MAIRIVDINTLPPEQVAADMHQAASERRNYFLFRHQLASGEVRDVEVHSNLLDVGDRRLLYSIVHDIANRRRAEEALRASEAHFREFFGWAPLDYFELDRLGCFTRVNRAFVELLGYSPDEILGHPLWELSATPELSGETTLARLAGSESLSSFERTYRRRDGSLVHVAMQDRLLNDSDGRVSGLYGLIQDIGVRKRIEEERLALAQEQAVRAEAERAQERLSFLATANAE